MSIRVDDLTCIFEPGTTYEKTALSHISLEIKPGEFIGLIGHTGSGKSTLIQRINGLEKPTSGTVYYNGTDIFAYSDKKALRRAKKRARRAKEELNYISGRELRRHVGLVFQYPEYQLFETTIRADVAFGPKKLGLSDEEVDRRVREALGVVGIPEELMDTSPFALSGGQRRRVAIAGILAMEPEYLILDEPTAGLDPQGREELLNELSELRTKRNMAIILVSHSMDDVARFVDRLIVLSHGELIFDAPPREVFREEAKLTEIGLDVPEVTRLGRKLREQGFDLPETVLSLDEMEALLKRELEKRGFKRAETDGESC